LLKKEAEDNTVIHRSLAFLAREAKEKSNFLGARDGKKRQKTIGLDSLFWESLKDGKSNLGGEGCVYDENQKREEKKGEERGARR